MGRYFFTILLSLIYVSNVVGQDKEIDKLIFLYIDENYTKCVNKGLNLIGNDDYRRKPLPYLYVSMSYYELARDEEMIEKYPKAFKNAMKYAYKYRKKDKTLEYVGKYKDYFLTLKDSAIGLGQIYFKTENWRKAAYTFEQITRFDPDAHLMFIWQGISEIKARNVGEGELVLRNAMEKIDDNYMPSKVELEVAYRGFTEYANYMDAKGDYAATKKGKKLAERFKEYDPEVIKKKKAEEAEKNKPVKVVKSFETTEEEAKNQKTKFIGSDEDQVKDAKSEIEQITKEQQEESKPKFKTFSSEDE